MIDSIKLANESRASQDNHELRFLLAALQNVEVKRVLEIGVHKGFSCEVWRKAWPKAQVIGIDNEPQFLEYKDFELIVGDSHDRNIKAKAWMYGPVDFLFIDGDHSYDGTLLDWEWYSPLVRPGGIVAIHDISRRGPEWEGKVDTCKVYEHLALSHNHLTIENPNELETPGVGVIYL